MLLGDEVKSYFLSIKRDDVNFELMHKIFSKKGRKNPTTGKMEIIPPMYDSRDTIFLKAGEYFNKTNVETGLGMFMWNKFIIEGTLQDILGYWNETLDASKFESKFERKINNALLMKKITPDEYIDYLNRKEEALLHWHNIFCGSFTENFLFTDPEILKRRDELIEENIDKIEKGDILTVQKISKELKKILMSKYGDDPSFELVNSGARGGYDSYEKIAIMGGANFNPITGTYDVIVKSLLEGIEKKDISVAGNSIVSGAYPKAIETQDGGQPKLGYLTQ